MLRAIRPPRVFDVLAEAQIRNDPVNVAQLPVLNHFSNLDAQREEPRPNRLHQEQFLLLGRFDQFLRLRRVDRECLLAQDVFTR